MNWLKLAPYIAGAAFLALIWGWHVAKVHQADVHGYQRAMTEVAKEREAEKASNERIREDSEHAYQSTITDLQTRVDALSNRPEPPIRLCKPSAHQVRVPESASVPDASTDAGSDPEAGEDIRPRLVQYGRDCEAIRQQLTALQAWIQSVQ